MTDPPPSPGARRLGTPRWWDARLVVGVLLVLVSVLAGARLLSASGRSQTVWAAARDLAPGTQLAAGDLKTARVRLYGNPGRYVSGRGAPPYGFLLRRGVGAQELLPFAALTRPGGDLALRYVTVPVGRGHLAPNLRSGTQVDVYVSPERRAGVAVLAPSEVSPRLVVRNVTVLQRPRTAGFAGGGTSDEAVVLAVRPTDVPSVLAAMSSGRIDLVGVPSAQEAPVRTLPEGSAS